VECSGWMGRIVVLAALTMFSAGALAEEPRFEVTPFAGYRLSGDLESAEDDVRADVDDSASWGVELGLYRDSLSYYQVLYSGRDAEIDVAAGGRSSPDVRIEYYHFGGTLLFPQPRGYIGFFSATIGVTRFDARSSGYDSDNEFSGSLGGGVRFPFSDRIHGTFGVRSYATFVDRDTGLVCVSDGGGTCLIKSTGRLFWEIEGYAGLTFRF
jgi:hypothetical protein